MTAPASEAVISLTGVRVAYDGVQTLQVDRLDALAGQVLAVIGPNGSGKSTLLRVMGCLERPVAGDVRWHGQLVAPAGALDVRRRIAVVFQQPLLAAMTVADNVALGLRFRGVSASDRRERVEHWLARFGIADLAGRRSTTLSGGEAQRVALARALVLDPELLLLDEPFSSLDAPARVSLVADLAAVLHDEHVSTVLVTHDRAEARALGDRVAVLIGGRVRQIGQTPVVFRAPVSEDVARFVGMETILAGEVTAAGRGTAVVAIAGRALKIAGAATPGERVRVAIHPDDVVLVAPDGASRAANGSNRLPGRVVQVRASTPELRVVVDCGFRLVAGATARAVDELGLVPGTAVIAELEPGAPHLLRDPSCLDTPAGERL